MSLELHVLVAGELPQRHLWQAAIDRLGIPVQLDPALDVETGRGYSPCKLRGEDSGFELGDEAAGALVDTYPTLAKAAGSGPRSAITFRWSGDMSECACVLGAAAGLVAGFGGVAYYPADDLLYDLGGLKLELDAALAELGA
jgi:hypothetical protein